MSRIRNHIGSVLCGSASKKSEVATKKKKEIFGSIESKIRNNAKTESAKRSLKTSLKLVTVVINSKRLNTGMG